MLDRLFCLVPTSKRSNTPLEVYMWKKSSLQTSTKHDDDRDARTVTRLQHVELLQLLLDCACTGLVVNAPSALPGIESKENSDNRTTVNSLKAQTPATGFKFAIGSWNGLDTPGVWNLAAAINDVVGLLIRNEWVTGHCSRAIGMCLRSNSGHCGFTCVCLRRH